MAESGFGRALVSLQHRDFRLLFLSHIVAGIGGQLLNVSNFWQVYALTGSALHLGLTGVARAIPILFFSLVGGVVADRFDRRKIIVVTQVASGAASLMLAVLTGTGAVEVWHIYVVVFVHSTVMSAAGPARRAVMVTVVPREHLMNAMALQAWVGKADHILAPSLAGILIGIAGTALTYGLNGITHLITAATLVFVSASLVPVRPAGRAARGEPRFSGTPGRLALAMDEGVEDLREGLAFVRTRSIILVVMVMDFAAMIVGNYIVLLPILADTFGVGPVGFGLLNSAPAVGSLFAATVLLSLGDFRYKGWLIAVSLLGYGTCLAVLGLAPWFWLALVAVAGLGLTDALQQITRNAVIQLLTPDELRGRVTAFQHMLIAGGPSGGQAVLGGLASAVGVPIALLIGAAVCVGVNLGLLVKRTDLRSADLAFASDELRVTNYELARPAIRPS